jgi:hypothetical protein
VRLAEDAHRCGMGESAARTIVNCFGLTKVAADRSLLYCALAPRASSFLDFVGS